MKKIRTIILSFIFLLAMCSAAFAADYVPIGENSEMAVFADQEQIYCILDNDKKNVTIDCWLQIDFTDAGREKMGDGFNKIFYNADHAVVHMMFQYGKGRAIQRWLTAYDASGKVIYEDKYWDYIPLGNGNDATWWSRAIMKQVDKMFKEGAKLNTTNGLIYY